MGVRRDTKSCTRGHGTTLMGPSRGCPSGLWCGITSTLAPYHARVLPDRGHADRFDLANAATDTPSIPPRWHSSQGRRVLDDQPDTGFLQNPTDERLTVLLASRWHRACRGLGSFMSPADIDHGRSRYGELSASGGAFLDVGVDIGGAAVFRRAVEHSVARASGLTKDGGVPMTGWRRPPGRPIGR